MSTLTHATTLVSLECCECGGAMAFSAKWVTNARAEAHGKHMFTCPYCKTHQGWMGKSQAERKEEQLKAQIEQLEKSKQWLEDRRRETAEEAEHFRRSRDGMKGALSKIKKRVGRGTCPCCNRHFSNLQRHMENKHPEVKDGTVQNPDLLKS